MRYQDIKAAIKTELVKEAGDKEKLYLRLEHENSLNRLARGIGYTGLGAATGAAIGTLTPKLPRAALGLSGGLIGAIAANTQSRAERVSELKQLLRMAESDHRDVI